MNLPKPHLRPITSIPILLLTLLPTVALADSGLTTQHSRLPDLSQAAVFTINEFIDNDRALNLAQKVPSDLYIRGWFKWNRAHDFSRLAHYPAKAHQSRALFGGGVTCSALYHGENGLTEDQVRDFATRGPSNQLVDAWGLNNVRHGTLSNPKYIDYVLSWCFKQIDAGADYLFMDEINAALHANEGFDDYALRDFRAHLATVHPDWAANDPRWRDKYKIDLADKSIAPDNTLHSFDYRAYVKAIDCVADPLAAKNPLSRQWWAFRRLRDDRAWERMTAQIRAYAKSKGRTVYISGNGLATRVDLQVLGVWGLWLASDGRIDLSHSQIGHWAGQVRAGHAMAGKKVPVVFFHDWGTTGFPYQQVPAAQRNLWNRIRGAEIYAAGGFYAFPVLGPYQCDAERDGTLDEIIRQATFYARNRALYLDADMRGFECVTPADPTLGASLWTGRSASTVMLHVINRKVNGERIETRQNVTIDLPSKDLPASASVVSPDWQGEQKATVEQFGAGARLTIPHLEAYAVAVLRYDRAPALDILPDRIALQKMWARPLVSEFKVGPFGAIADLADLNGVLQGHLHSDMANPPTFVMNAKSPAKLSLNVQAVATQGARLEFLLNGKVVKEVEIADRDRKNDTSAHELDYTIDVEIPAGQHRLTVQNTGKDWASVNWLRFTGDFAD